MSYSARRSPRFSYTTSPPVCPTELLGQSTFFDDGVSNAAYHPCINRPPRTVYKASSSPISLSARASTNGERGYFTEDEKRLMALLGGGLIAALVIDAVAHSIAK